MRGNGRELTYDLKDKLIRFMRAIVRCFKFIVFSY